MPVYSDKKTGRFYIQFDFKGRTYRRRLPAGTLKKDAKLYEARWRSDLLGESFGIEKKREILFEAFLVKYFLPFAVDHYVAAGYENVKVICAAALPFFKGKRLRRITPADIEAFKNHRLKLPTIHDTPRKPSTVDRELNVVSKIFSYAVKLDFLDFNPCAKIDRPRYQNIQDKTIGFDKLEKFLDNFNSVWARDVTILILYTGLRQKDALGLKKFNADFDKRILRLIQSKSGRVVEIPMNEIVFALLSARRHNGSELFFPSPRTGLQGTSIKKGLQAAAERAELGKIGTRVLRRTFSTQLEELNHSPSTIAKLLGHSDLRSVHRYERGKEIMRRAVEELEKGKSNQNPTGYPNLKVVND